jgi:hypothetical protein
MRVSTTGPSHRTPRRQPRVICCIDTRRDPALGFGAVGAARLPPRSLWMARQRFRERRRLSKPGTPRRIELLLQPLVLLAQPVTLTLDALKLALQSLDLALRLLDLGDRLLLRPMGWRVIAHASVMPEERDLYKSRRSAIAIEMEVRWLGPANQIHIRVVSRLA